MTGFAVSALVERRREIQREIAYLEGEIKRCEEAIGHVDATIHLLDPYYDLTKLKPKKFVAEDSLFYPGETPVLVLEILRAANHPMTTPEITMAMLARKGGPEMTGQHFPIGKLVGMASTRTDVFPDNKKLSERAGTIASLWLKDLHWNSHNDMGNWSFERLQNIAGDLRPILRFILMEAIPECSSEPPTHSWRHLGRFCPVQVVGTAPPFAATVATSPQTQAGERQSPGRDSASEAAPHPESPAARCARCGVRARAVPARPAPGRPYRRVASIDHPGDRR